MTAPLSTAGRTGAAGATGAGAVWGGGYWGPYPVGPVSTYDRFQVEFRDNKVVAFSQEFGP